MYERVSHDLDNCDKTPIFIYLMKNSDLAATIHLSCVAILAVVAVVLANTWAKKNK